MACSYCEIVVDQGHHETVAAPLRRVTGLTFGIVVAAALLVLALR